MICAARAMPFVVSWLALAGCQRNTDEVVRTSAAPTRDDFIRCAVELGCLAKSLEDARELAARAPEITRRYGFTAESWTAAAQAQQTDPSISEAIAAGVRACPMRPAEGKR